MSVIALARVVRDDLLEARNGAEQAILNGHPTSFDEYRFLTGKRAGLETALALLDEAVKRFDEQD